MDKEIINNLKILPGRKYKGKHMLIECLCLLCNKVSFKRREVILAPNRKSCGCLKYKRGYFKNNLTGRVFERLTVLKFHSTQTRRGGGGKTLWTCSCSCGNEKIASSSSLEQGAIKSCGCLKKDRLKIFCNEDLWKKLFDDYKRSAIKRNLEFKLSLEEFTNLITKPCIYCRSYGLSHIKTSKFQLSYTGLDRKDNSLGYVFSNCSPCCKFCNGAKRSFSEKEFLNWFYFIQNKTVPQQLKIEVRSPKEYTIDCNASDKKECREFIIKNHYSQTCPINIKYAFKLLKYNKLIGVCLFSAPSRTNITVPNATKILELTRLYIYDGTPKNTESYFIGTCLRWLKVNTDLEAVVSFSDPTEGHQGTIYKATNFKFIGQTTPNYHYVTLEGKRIHKKQVWDRAKANNITEQEQAKQENLTKVLELPKNKFVYYLNEKV